MWTKGVIFIIGAFFTYSEILQSQHVSATTGDIFIAELMVESNVTLELQTILTILREITTISVTDSDGASHVVTFLNADAVAECLIVGVETSCNCSAGYIFSNEVCYNFNCCRETTCHKNVSYITPLCIPKVPIYINGTATLSLGSWLDANTATLTTKFQELNGFESLNITGTSGGSAEFEVGLSVKFDHQRLEDMINTLQTVLMAYIFVDTDGMVYIEHPNKKVCYHSTPILKCTFEQHTAVAGFNMSKTYERFELNNGSVVVLDHACHNAEYPSCVAVKLREVTGSWEGMYECGFTKGSVRHTAKAHLIVARLPDEILITTDPLTGDCSEHPPTGSIDIKVTVTIEKTNNSYVFEWQYRSHTGTAEPYDADTDLKYTFNVPISCENLPIPQTVSVTFENDIKQKRNANVTLPVIYEGEKFCAEETVDGCMWPKTPNKDTAINHTCTPGRVGYRTRTCVDSKWDTVFDSCVNEELNKIANAATSFLKGLGATQSVALDIFSGLQNNTGSSSGDSDNIADLGASVTVLGMMAQASKNVDLGEVVLPAFLNAASNMLNKTWHRVNSSVLHSMSANYLESVEGLVDNIGVNASSNNTALSSSNIDMKFCGGSDCDMNIFGIGLQMNRSSGIVKAVALKNLMAKLKNTFKNTAGNTDENALIMSVTLQQNTDSNISVQMIFPVVLKDKQKPHCVFWETKKNDFDNRGCEVKAAANSSGMVTCMCNHLTSFSVLMARGDVSNPVLDVITYVGLAVSIVSLILFLIIEYLVWGAVVKTKLSHYRHTSMVNIALFLLLANICFLATIEPTKLSPDTCLALTICKHLFFLIKFHWMLCLSAMLVHQLIFVFNPLRKKVFMYLSSLVGYMVPIVIVIITYIYYKYTNKPYHNPDLCWLTYDSLLVGSLHAFLIPIGVILLSNIFSMVVVIVTLVKSSKNDSSKTDEKDTARSIIKVILVLAPVFGVTWTIGFCLVVFNDSHPAYQFFNYTFTIVNSFQGLFVLLTGFMAEQKVKDELYKIITGKKGSSDSTKNLTSTMYTKDK